MIFPVQARRGLCGRHKTRQQAKIPVSVFALWQISLHPFSARELKLKTAAAAWQVPAVGVKDYVSADGIRVAPALSLLGDLV